MTVATPAAPVPLMYGLGRVADHLSAVLARPAAAIPPRLDLFWATLQPTNPTNAPAGQNDTFSPGFLDTLHAQCAANGITHAVGCLSYSPGWAGGTGDGHQLPRGAADGSLDYANVCRLILWYWHDQNYDDDVKLYLERWNEPQNGFAGALSLTLRSNYIKLLQTSALACRSGKIVGREADEPLPHFSAGDDLWTGGTGAAPAVGSPYRHLNWLQSIVDADADCFDHVAFHPYPSGCDLSTLNAYGPWKNDVAQMRAYLDAHGRTDAYLNATEVGWFWRPDGTATKSDCGNECNCNSYGVNAGNPNLAIEVDVTTLATRITNAGATWKGSAATYKLGFFGLYQQDTTAPNNTDTDGSGGPAAAFNHAGLYAYDPARAGAPVLDGSGNPAPLNAFLALQTAHTTPPVITIGGPTPSQVVTGTFAIAAGVTDAVTAAASLKVKWGTDGIHYPNALPYVTPAFGVNRLSPQDSTDGSWPNGPYTVHIRAINAAGNKTFASVSFTVNNAAAGAPKVTGVSPPTGAIAGGDAVTVTGTNLTGATAVRFNRGSATSVVVVDDSTITCVSPAESVTAEVPFLLGFAVGAGAPLNAELDAFVLDGGTVVRAGFAWDSMDTNMDGTIESTTDLDRVLIHAASIGLQVIVQIARTSDQSVEMSDPAIQPVFAAFVANLAAYLDGNTTVQAVEIGNETDTGPWSQDQPPYGGYRGQAYAVQLIRIFGPSGQGFEDVRSRTDRPVIWGGTARSDPLTYFKEAHGRGANPAGAGVTVDGHSYPDGALGMYDAVTFHPYDEPGVASSSLTDPDGTGAMIDTMEWLFATFAITPDLYITEYGYPTYANADGTFDTPALYAKQSAALTDMAATYATLLAVRGWNLIAFCWFEFMDKSIGSNPQGKAYHWGVATDTAGTFPVPAAAKKPAYATFQSLLVSTGGGVVDVTVIAGGASSPIVKADQFTYLATAPVPMVTNVAPASGDAAGGDSVVITGTTFTPVTAVMFGSTTAASFTVDSATQITAVSPVHAAATVDVTVVAPAGTSATSTSDRFTFVAAPPPPAVASVSPTSGTTAGGDSLTIVGTGFTGATAVTVGGTNMASFTVNSDTSITATSPAHAAGTKNVKVTTPNGTSPSGAGNKFTFVVPPIPVVASLSPDHGPQAGGTSVTITGSAFTGATGVTFDGTAATSVVVVDDSTITCVTPAGTDSGVVDTQVTTPAGTNVNTAGDDFTYDTTSPPSAPTVTGLSPTSGVAGTVVTVTGTDLDTVTSIRFAGADAPTFTLVSPTQLTVTAPAHADGRVTVYCTNPSGESGANTAAKFTYGSPPPPAPTVTAVAPDTGPQAGGTTVVVTGTGFVAPVTVLFDATAAASFTINSSTQITAVSPPGTTGTVDIIVANVSGPSDISDADAFTYPGVPTVAGVSPSSGAVAGGDTITITGTGFEV